MFFTSWHRCTAYQHYRRRHTVLIPLLTNSALHVISRARAAAAHSRNLAAHHSWNLLKAVGNKLFTSVSHTSPVRQLLRLTIPKSFISSLICLWSKEEFILYLIHSQLLTSTKKTWISHSVSIYFVLCYDFWVVGLLFTGRISWLLFLVKFHHL